MSKRQRVSESAGTSTLESKALRLGVSRPSRTNLAPNPTCNVNLAGWTGNAGTGGSGTSARVATGGAVAPSFHRTTLSLCPDPPSSGTTIGSVAAGANAIPVSPGFVSISAYVRTVTLNRTAQMTATFLNAAGAALGSSQSAVTNTWLGWARMVVETVAPAATARVTVRISPVDSGPYSVGSTFDTGSVLVEALTPVDTYFDGTTAPTGGALAVWTGTAGASSSVANYPVNVVPDAPNAAASPDPAGPAHYLPGLSACRATVSAGYPVPGLLLTHVASSTTDAFTFGMCSQQLFPDNDLAVADPMPPLTRTWSDSYGWNPWTSSALGIYDEGNLVEDLTSRVNFTGAGVGVTTLVDGQVTVNVPGTMGLIFYPDPTDASDIATYKKLRLVPSTAAESTLVTACTGTGDVLVAAFASDPGTPGAVDFPAGIANRSIYASVSAGTARLHLQVYKRDAAGVETLVRDEFSPNFTDLTATLQAWSATTTSAGTLTATDRLVMKLYAQRVAGSASINVTTYFEGTLHTSSISTTIAAGAPIGSAGGDLTGTYPNPTLAPATASALMLDVAEEGTTVQADAGRINFVGAGVTAAADGSGGATVTVPGGGGALPQGYIPGTMLGATGTANVLAASTYLPIPWVGPTDAAHTDPLIWTAANPDKLFAPVAGRYAVSGTVVFQSNATGYRHLYVGKVKASDGSGQVLEWVALPPVTGNVTVVPFAIGEINMAAGDYINVNAWHTATASIWVGGSTGTAVTRVSMTYINETTPTLTPDPGLGVMFDGATTTQTTVSTALIPVPGGASGDFVVPRSGKVMIGISGYVRSSVAGQYSHLGWQFVTTGPGTFTTFTAEAFSTQDTGFTKATMWTMVTGLTPGAVHTVRAAFLSGLATNTASVASTRITVLPIDAMGQAAGLTPYPFGTVAGQATVAVNASAAIPITFATPMPDLNYGVVIHPESVDFTYTISAKTVNGCTVTLRNKSAATALAPNFTWEAVPTTGGGYSTVGIVPGGYAEITANSAQNPSTTAVVVAGLSVSVNLSALRRYRVSAMGTARSTAVNDREGIQILKDGVLWWSGAVTVPAVANVGEQFSCSRVDIAPTAGVHTYALAVNQATGGPGLGGVFIGAASVVPAYIMVEDIGPA